jgi:cystathionine beta-lyase
MIELDRFEAITADDLRRQGGLKWTTYPDTLAAWVAEMDFGVAPPIAQALHEAIDVTNFGYLPRSMRDSMATACSSWLDRDFGWTVPAEQIRPIADVLTAYEHALTSFAPADRPAVIVPTPAYAPFLTMPRSQGRRVIEVPLIKEGDRYILDLDALDAAFGAGGGLLVLCDPHNPTGTVYTEAEHLAVAEVVARHGGRVFSDQIHAPIVYGDSKHVPYASVSETAAGHTLSAISAAKGWNLPGLKAAQLILSNEDDVLTWGRVGLHAEHGASNLGVIAATAAYSAGGQWIEGIRDYLLRNRDHLLGRLSEELPLVGTNRGQGTYFAWLDLRAFGLGSSPVDTVRERAAVTLTDGATCGEAGQGFLRLNYATPRPILDQIVDRLVVAL